MEYDVENEAERRQALQRFYEEYDAVRRKYGLTMSAHASIFDDCWIRIWQGSGIKKRMIIKVENESETQCYRVATEALISWVKTKKHARMAERR